VLVFDCKTAVWRQRISGKNQHEQLKRIAPRAKDFTNKRVHPHRALSSPPKRMYRAGLHRAWLKIKNPNYYRKAALSFGSP
jgi:hypothetical protein